MILRIASSRIVGQGDIVGRSGYFSLNLSANSVMRGRLDARRTLKSLVADLRNNSNGIALMTIVHYTTDYFEKYGLKDINGIQSISDVNIYPKEYFCPKGPNSDKCNITTNTKSIHHYAASWYTWKTRLVIFIRKVLGERFLTYLLRLKQMI